MGHLRIWLVVFLALSLVLPYLPIHPAKAAANSFSFAAAGDLDHNSNTNSSLLTLANMQKDPTTATNFFLGIGDLSYASSGAENQWCNLVKSYVGSSYPFELLSGNHEDGKELTSTNGLIDNFVKNTCLPDQIGVISSSLGGGYGKEYYFDYPATNPVARFILVSPNLNFTNGGYYDYSASSAHYNWLSSTIDDGRSKGIPWVIVGMHEVCISAGVEPCRTHLDPTLVNPNNGLGIGQDLMTLLLNKRVDLVLQAHDHNYQRSKQLTCAIAESFQNSCVANDGSTNSYAKGAGTVFVIDGTFGAPPAAFPTGDPDFPYFAKLSASTYGFVRYSVSASSIDAQFVPSSAGGFSDSFSIGGPAGASFSLSANPNSVSFQAGSSSSSVITFQSLPVGSATGFSGVVSLTNSVTVGGAPSSSLTVSCPSSVSLTAGGSTTATCIITASIPNTYTVTITGTGGAGAIASSATVTVVVSPLDFSLSASPTSLTAIVGATSTVTIAPLSGFTGTVTLATAVSPAGLTCALSSTNIVLGSTQSSTLSCSGRAGVYTVTVIGTSGTLSHSASVAYTIQDFTVTASPSSVTALAGATTTSTITVAPLQGYTGTVVLATSVSPAGPTCSLSSTSVLLGASQTSIISCAGPAGVYTVTVTGASAGFSNSAIVTLTIQDFTVSANPIAVIVAPGATAISTITVAPQNGFTGTVTLSISFPVGLTCLLSSTSLVLGASQTSTLSCKSVSQNPLTVTVTGTSGSLSHAASVVITDPADFRVDASPTSVTVNAGDTGSSTITVTSLGGFNGTINLSSSAPAGLTCSLTLPSVTVTLPSPSATSGLSCNATIANDYAVTVSGTNGTLTRLTSVITFHVVDFSISASSPSAVPVGSNPSSTITVSASNTFSGSVTLTDTIPASLTCFAISPGSVTGSGSATLSCSSTSTGQFVVTVTGTSGSLVHTATATFNFVDFSIAVTSPANVVGSSAISTITVTSQNGFSGSVSLSNSQPAGLVCLPITPASVSGSGSASLSCLSTVANSFTVTITGTSGSLRHSADATFSFTSAPDFTISATSPSAVDQAQSAVSTITVTAQSGFTGTVSLAATTIPSGLNCTGIAPASVAGSGTATFSCSSNVPGSYTVTITGTSTSPALTHSTTASFSFVGFSITATSPGAVSAGLSATSTITVSALNGFTGTVSLTDTVPSGLACGAIAPPSITGSGSATVSCSSATAGSFSLGVTGTSGSLSHSSSATFTFNAPQDFTIGATSPAGVDTGLSATSTITITSLNGFAGTVLLTDNVPNGLTCSPFSPGSVTGSGTASLSCSSSSVGSFTVTVSGTSGSLTHGTTATFNFKAPVDFGMAAGAVSPAQIPAGSAGASSLTVTAQNGFTGIITLSQDAGTACSLSPPSISLTATTTSASATLTCTFTGAGSNSVTVTGASGLLSHSATATFHVVDFAISANPTSVTSTGGAATSTITITALNGFSGAVGLSANNGACTLSPNSVVGSGTATLSCTFASATTNVVAVTGTSGSLSHTATVTFTTQDFTIAANPTTVPINTSASGSSTITVSALNGFAGTVSLASAPVVGLACTISPSSVGVSVPSTLTCTPSSVGTFSVTVTGSSGSLSHGVAVTFTKQDFSVTASPAVLTVNAGFSAISTITVSPGPNGFTGDVSLSATAAPAGPTTSFLPSTVTLTGTGSATSQLTISTSTGASGTYLVTVTASSGSLSHTTIVTLTVSSDFAISASGLPLRINVGLSATATITATSTGFTGSVSLSASVSPSGPSASLNPTSIPLIAGGQGNSALTITVPSTTVAGNYTFTVTGSGGGINHIITFTVAVADFGLSASPITPPSFPAGSSATSTITLASLGSFSGTVSLSASASAPGLSLSLSPSSVTLAPGRTSTSILTISSTSATLPGTYTITVTGFVGLLSHQVILSLSLTGFTISVTPNSITLPAGSTGTATITVASVSGFTGTVSLTASISNVGATPNPSSVTLTPGSSAISTLTVFTSKNLTPGTYDGTVTGTVTLTSGTLSQKVPITVVVTDFTIAGNPSSLSIVAGSAATSIITVTGLNGFSGTVNLTAVGSISGLTATFNPITVLFSPSTLSATSTLTITVASTVPTGTHTVTVTGTDGTLSHSTTITVTVGQPPDFSLFAGPASPSPVPVGGTATSSLTVTSLFGFSGPVALSVAVSPSGPVASLNPTGVTLTANVAAVSTLTFSSLTAGTYSLTITGTSGSLTHTTALSITVMDFTITADTSSLVVRSGSPGSFTVTLVSRGGLTGNVTLSEASSPTVGLVVGCSPSSVTLFTSGTSSSSCTVTSSTPASYTVSVTGTIGSLVHSVSLSVSVVDFTIAANPLSFPVVAGSSGISTITLTSVGPFNGIVSLTATISPIVANAPTLSLSPSSLQLLPAGTALSGLTVTAKTTSPIGSYLVTVTGTSGSLTHSLTIAVNVTQAADFSVSASPVSLDIPSGSSGTSIITFTSLNGFSGTLAVTSTVSIAGATASLNPPSVTVSPTSTGSSVLTVSSSVPGDYTVTVTGTDGALSHSVAVPIRVVDFGISASRPSITVLAGVPAQSDLTFNSIHGFAGTITIATSSSTGLTASLSTQTVALAAGGSVSALLTVSAPISGNFKVNITGTSGSISHSILVFVNVIDFSISVNPSISIAAGSSGTLGITLNGLNGFSGSVSLSETPPAGLTASASPNSLVLSPTITSATSTLTITVVATTLPGIYSVGVVGLSGGVSHSATVTVTVIAPLDFAISPNPVSLSFPAGSSGTSVITLTSLNGFSGTLTLTSSVSGGPGATLNPTTVTLSAAGSATSTLTVFTKTSVSPGSYVVTVIGTGTGTSGPITRSTTVTIFVTDFLITSSPTSIAVQAGTNALSTITVTGLNGFSGIVNLTAVGSINGLTATPSPTSVSVSSSASSTLTITVTLTVLAGTHTVTVTGAVGALFHSTTITVTVSPASDFSINASPLSVPVLRGSSGSATITIMSLNGFQGNVALSATVSSLGFVPSLLPNTVTLVSGGSGLSTLTLPTSPSTPIGTYTVIVTGTGPTGLPHSVSVTVIVGDFTINSNPSILTIQSSSSGTSTVTVASQSGFTGNVTLSISVSPPGPTASLSSLSIVLAAGGSGTSILTFNSGTTTTPGPYTVTVIGSSGSVSHNIVVTVNIVDFSISNSQTTLSFAAGSSATTSLNFASLGGFSGFISIGSSVSTSGLQVSCNPTTLFLPLGSIASSSCKFSSSTVGVYVVTLSGANQILLHSVTVTVTVVSAPDFIISPNPTSLIVDLGTLGSSVITVTGINGFSGNVNLTATVSTAGLTTSLNPTSVIVSLGGSGSSTLTVTSSIPATFTVTLAATSGVLSHSTTVSVRIVDFSISASSTILTIVQGTSGSTDITIGSVGDFAGNVSLSVTVSPTGLTPTLTPTIVKVPAGAAAKSTLTVTSSLPQTYTLTVVGTSGSLIHSTSVTVSVGDFTINASPNSLTVPVSQSGTVTITITSIFGFSNTVSLSHSVLPAGPSLSISPSSVPVSSGGTGTSSLTIVVPSSTTPGLYVITVTGVSGGASHTTSISMTVGPALDFTLSASPQSLNVAAGSSNSTTLTLTSINGFTGLVSLTTTSTAAILSPAMVNLTPNGSGTSTVTVTSTVAGSFTVTVTATFGSLSHSVPITVNVVDFRIASSSSVKMTAGIQTTTDITLTSLSGFSGTIVLSVSPSSGVSAFFSSTSVTLPPNQPISATLTLNAATAGTFSVTVTGTSGSLAHSSTLAIVVTDFTIAPSPTSLTVQVGSFSTTTITLSALNGFCCFVSLTASVSSPGLGTSFSVSPVGVSGGTATSTLSVAATSSTLPGTYTVTVTGTGGGSPHSATITVNVVDFTIASSQPFIVADVGSLSNSTITVLGVNGFSGTIILATSVLTPGLTATLNPVIVTISPSGPGVSTLTVSSLIASTYTVTVTATSGTLSRSVVVSVRLVDFTISAGSTTLTVVQGSSASTDVTVSSVDQFARSVSLSATPSSSGLAASLSQTIVSVSVGVPGRSTLSISSTNPQTYTISVVGMSGSLSHSVTITVVVVDFTINASPSSLIIAAGSSGTATLTLGSVNGFSSTVSLSHSVSPAGPFPTVSPSIVPVSSGGTGTSIMTIVVPSSTLPDNYTITVTGVSGGAVHSFLLSLKVSPLADFTVTAPPQSIIVQAGASGSTTLTLTSFNRFTGVVTLSTSSSVAILSPTIVNLAPNGSGTSTVTVTSSVAGAFTVIVIATSGQMTHSVTISGSVVDFRIFGQSTVKTQAGVQGTTDINLMSQAGFSGTISLSVSASPGLSAFLNSYSVSLTANQQLSSSLTISSAVNGNYVVTITGTSGLISHTIQVIVVVQDYGISSSSSSLTIVAGLSTSANIDLTSLNGFCCSVSLSASVYPTLVGVTASVSPNQVGLQPAGSASAGLTILASSIAPAGTYVVTVTGSSGSGGLLHTVTVTVTVTTDFAVASDPVSLTFPAGATGTARVLVSTSAGFSGTVNLSVTGFPNGLFLTLSQQSVTLAPGQPATVTLTISTNSTTALTSYTITVTGTSGSLTHSASLALILTPAAVISAPSSESVNAGSVLTFRVNASDPDSSKILTLSAVAFTMPSPDATFPTVSGSGTVSGIFNWKPSVNQAAADYLVTFTVSDGHGGVSSAQVKIHVNNVNRTGGLLSSLSGLGAYWYAILAALAAGTVVAGDLLLKKRRVKMALVAEESS